MYIWHKFCCDVASVIRRCTFIASGTTPGQARRSRVSSCLSRAIAYVAEQGGKKKGRGGGAGVEEDLRMRVSGCSEIGTKKILGDFQVQQK